MIHAVFGWTPIINCHFKQVRPDPNMAFIPSRRSPVFSFHEWMVWSSDYARKSIEQLFVIAQRQRYELPCCSSVLLLNLGRLVGYVRTGFSDIELTKSDENGRKY